MRRALSGPVDARAHLFQNRGVKFFLLLAMGLAACTKTRQPVEAQANQIQTTPEQKPEMPQLPLFSPGPYGIQPMDVAGPFSLPVTGNKTWSLEDNWNGQDSYVFIFRNARSSTAQALWNSSLNDLLTASPPNVHYFFLSYESTAAQDAAAMQIRINDAPAAWRPRLHVVPKVASGLSGWFAEALAAGRKVAIAIDRFQRWRDVGNLTDMNGQTNWRALARLPQQFNHEWQREGHLLDDHVVTLAQNGGGMLEVELPSADDLAQYDALQIDMSMTCDGHLDANCPDWDMLTSLSICAVDNPENCDSEIARWVTPYHREGRWVTEITPMLAQLYPGGKRRFRFDLGQPYHVDLKLRFGQRGAALVPKSALWLYSGGDFGPDYNKRYTPITFQVPPGTARVTLYALVTGHGWGKDADNCAEFCNHTHHFTINGQEFVKTNNDAGTASGCAARVEDGVVPNQWGSWPFGRSGWCPGMDVKPWEVDLTNVVHAGDNTITYKGLFGGNDYVPRPAASADNNGFGANINLRSYLVFWGAAR